VISLAFMATVAWQRRQEHWNNNAYPLTAVVAYHVLLVLVLVKMAEG
jgi:hypothetical protein